MSPVIRFRDAIICTRKMSFVARAAEQTLLPGQQFGRETAAEVANASSKFPAEEIAPSSLFPGRDTCFERLHGGIIRCCRWLE